MNRLSRSVSIAGSMFIVAGLVAAVTVRTAATAPAALAAATVQGTDIYGQTDVTSWPDVKSAGMSFVGIQAANGRTVVNQNYGAQLAGALSEGLYVMPYVFADPLKIAGGAQFTRAWSVINSVPADPYAKGGQLLPIALDLENDPVVTSEYCYGLTPAKMVSWVRAFSTAARAKTGVVPIIYTSQTWWNRCTGSSTAFGADPLWVVDYGVSVPALPSGWTGYAFWQSSGTGTVGGISGPADTDQLQVAPTRTAKAGPSGSAQLETLNSLAGQKVSYVATAALPAGLALTSAGRLSWSSAVEVGKHQVAVTPVSQATPAVPVIPSSLAATLRVHGTISLATASRSFTAGAPVSLTIPSSGPDEKAGFTPALRAAGLPPGLSIRSGHLITGWAAKPGTYQVTVTATDGLGGTGSASFSAAVKVAADSGTAGTVRQVGGSGRCLNDPGGNTASGTRITLSTCTGKANQRWTTVQDGTLRTGGKCLSTVGNSTVSGVRLQLEACDAAVGAQHWRAGTDGQLVSPQSGKCLDVPAASTASTASTTQPVLAPCASSASQPNEHWLRPAAAIASGQPGTCVATSGTAVVLTTNCTQTAARRWQPRPDGTIHDSGKCLLEEGTTAGSPAGVGSCSVAAARWKLVAAGSIATELVSAASGLCLSTPASGRRPVMAACASAPATTWRVG